MASAPWTSSLAILALLASTSASAQQQSCGATDVDCRGAFIIIRELNAQSGEKGVRQFAVGTVCRDQELAQLGRAEYDRSVASVTAKARQAILAELGALPSGAVQKVADATSYTVRAARNAQASGMIASLESVFTMFPRSRAEYCKTVVPTLKTTPTS